MDRNGNWCSTYFGNDNQSLWREKPGLIRVEFTPNRQIIVAAKQPGFVLVMGGK